MPTEIGITVAIVLPISLALWREPVGWRLSPRRWAWLAAMAVVLIWAQSRSSWIAAVIGILIVWCSTGSWARRAAMVWLLGALAVAAAGALFLVSETARQQAIYCLSGRPLLWEAALNAVRQHPWVGIGPGAWSTWLSSQYASADFMLFDRAGNTFFLDPLLTGGEAHNLFLTKAAEMGLPSLLVLMLWIMCWFHAAGTIMKRLAPGWLHALTLGSIASMAGMVCLGLLEHGPLIGKARGLEVLTVWFVASIPFVASHLTGMRRQPTHG